MCYSAKAGLTVKWHKKSVAKDSENIKGLGTQEGFQVVGLVLRSNATKTHPDPPEVRTANGAIFVHAGIRNKKERDGER
jgi:hypothetical protein